ncbi:MAG TPA: GNAT family N-acetyltransferase [Feifaniaceae bacterium]|nr:GNAT family N-acetyltransferase [Feifaniaceae bacterium]
MERVRNEAAPTVAPLFEGWNETLLWSCLQGYMGEAWADDAEKPASAQIIVGDFCFFAGAPDTALVKNIPPAFPSETILMIPRDEAWGKRIEQAYPGRFQKTLRYAIKKEPDAFDRAKLRAYAETVPPNFSLSMLDEALYHKAKTEPWSRDLCSQFPTYDAFQEHGLGVMALYGDAPVSGAASYSVYDEGIEIEVDTKPEFRRRGLALACCAKLILACLTKGLYPSWDAHDLRSVALAEKLGYHLDKEYVTYAVVTGR